MPENDKVLLDSVFLEEHLGYSEFLETLKLLQSRVREGRKGKFISFVTAL